MLAREEETKALRGEDICPGLQNLDMVFDASLFGSRVHTHFFILCYVKWTERERQWAWGLLSVGHSNRGESSLTYSVNSHVPHFPEGGEPERSQGWSGVGGRQRPKSLSETGRVHRVQRPGVGRGQWGSR